MARHQFSAGVKCGKCGKVAAIVEAFSWRDAAEGRGVCDECVEQEKAQAVQVEAPAPEPMLDYAGRDYDQAVLAEPALDAPRKRSRHGKAGAV